ncbi:hypothetical protein I3842_14G049100 [Carya illinoinensis]|uniref:Uncharacterized protein n=1 Tax=Carya illinoinensis TaxID=32201 RepID=A0A922AAP9_CARIL|nr:hypothetical protein I3842_14G049100 [Carya illinoinensis]
MHAAIGSPKGPVFPHEKQSNPNVSSLHHQGPTTTPTLPSSTHHDGCNSSFHARRKPPSLVSNRKPVTTTSSISSLTLSSVLSLSSCRHYHLSLLDPSIHLLSR